MNWPRGSWVFIQCLLNVAAFDSFCITLFTSSVNTSWAEERLENWSPCYLSWSPIALIKHPGKSSLRRKDSGSRLRFSKVHNAGDILVVGVCSRWLNYIHGQETENHESWASASSPFYMVHGAFMVGLHTSINEIKFSGECFLEDSTYKLTVLPILPSLPQLATHVHTV